MARGWVFVLWICALSQITITISSDVSQEMAEEIADQRSSITFDVALELEPQMFAPVSERQARDQRVLAVQREAAMNRRPP